MRQPHTEGCFLYKKYQNLGMFQSGIMIVYL